jgi:hypothetical protein
MDTTAEPDRLQTAILAVGKDVRYLTESPTGQTDQVLAALDALPSDESGRETTFAAIQGAIEKYLDVRVKDRREVVLIVVTDESGDDETLVSTVVDTPRKYAIPVYVLGVPAPFGRLAGLPQSVEAKGDAIPADDGWLPIKQGPETMQLERINLAFSGDDFDVELIDSGSGPYGLECLCRETGGMFLAIQGEGRGSRFSSEWPRGGTVRFSPDVMRRYRPPLMSPEQYQALLAGNKACMALHRAAQLRRVDVLRTPTLSFRQEDQARMKQVLDQSQQAAAKVEGEINEMYEVLWDGMGDRDKLPDARWKASYDLAAGRIAAAKARVEGYNAMLAALKRGQLFENPNSTTWELQPSDSIEISSSLRSLIQRATESLQRVVDEHPGTPWAHLAARELESPMGWKWTER